MQQYYIYTPDGIQEGPYPEDMLRAGLAQGIYPEDTLIWCEGMDDWKKISEVISKAPEQTPAQEIGKQPAQRIKTVFSNLKQFLNAHTKTKWSIIAVASCLILGGVVYSFMPDEREAKLNAMFPGRTPERIKEIEGQIGKSLHSRSYEAILLAEVDGSRGSEKQVKQLLYIGTNPDVRDMEGNTPLHHAIQNERDEIAQLLISAGATPDIQNNKGEAPLHIAVQKSNKELVTQLIEAGANPNIRDGEGATPLKACLELQIGNRSSSRVDIEHEAYEKEKITEILLAAGADCSDINLKEEDNGVFLLNAAIGAHRIDLAKELIAAGVEVNSYNKHTLTVPLLKAAACGVDVGFLIDAGAVVTHKTIAGDSALYLAAAEDNVKNLDLLISAGVDVNGKDNYGNTPLHQAAARGKIKNIKILFKADADINSKNKGGSTPLHLAAYVDAYIDQDRFSKNGKFDEEAYEAACRKKCSGIVKTIKFLLKEGADVNAKDENQRTPLDVTVENIFENSDSWSLGAIFNGRIEAIKLLTAAPGIDITTPLYRAIKYADDAKDIKDDTLRNTLVNGIVPLLLNTPGFDINKPGINGETMLVKAANSGERFMVEKLLSFPGIDVNKATTTGDTPLMAAAANGNQDCLELLLNAPGINVKLRNNKGLDAFGVAVVHMRGRCIEVLAQHPDVDINARMPNGLTHLTAAIAANKTAVIEMLLDLPKLDINATCTFENGEITPLMLATAAGNKVAVELILRNPEVDVNKRGPKGETALTIAITQGDTLCARLIYKAGGRE